MWYVVSLSIEQTNLLYLVICKAFLCRNINTKKIPYLINFVLIVHILYHNALYIYVEKRKRIYFQKDTIWHTTQENILQGVGLLRTREGVGNGQN